jgi:hypothetical protein
MSSSQSPNYHIKVLHFYTAEIPNEAPFYKQKMHLWKKLMIEILD